MTVLSQHTHTILTSAPADSDAGDLDIIQFNDAEFTAKAEQKLAAFQNLQDELDWQKIEQDVMIDMDTFGMEHTMTGREWVVEQQCCKGSKGAEVGRFGRQRERVCVCVCMCVPGLFCLRGSDFKSLALASLNVGTKPGETDVVLNGETQDSYKVCEVIADGHAMPRESDESPFDGWTVLCLLRRTARRLVQHPLPPGRHCLQQRDYFLRECSQGRPTRSSAAIAAVWVFFFKKKKSSFNFPLPLPPFPPFEIPIGGPP